MDETNKKIDNADLEIDVTDFGYLRTFVSVDSGSAADVVENNFSEKLVFLYKNLYRIEERQKKLEESQVHLMQRQNATDSYFIDEMNLIKQELPSSKVNSAKSKIEEIQILLQENITTLTEIGELEDNWDEYGASKFEPELILKCIKFISKLELDYQPEIFPSPRKSIQIEFEPDENFYLEFEFFIDRIKLYKRIENNKSFMESISEVNAIEEIKKFRQEFTNSRLGVSL